MQRVFAIAWLTWKAAFRFRLFWVLSALLLGSVIFLPLMIKDDGTARGFTQILLTYTLGLITALLGFSTLWLACGTLARDIEDCQMQVVAVKPIGRWQIWIGKWVGLMMLNGALLALAGGSVYMLLMWRAKKLPAAQQEILREQIFIARGSLREAPVDLEAEVNADYQSALQKNSVPESERAGLRQALRERRKAASQVVPPGFLRRWDINLGYHRNTLRDQPLMIRVKFHAAVTNEAGLYRGTWQIGPTNSPYRPSMNVSLSAGAFQELRIPPNLFGDSDRLTIDFINRNDTALLFPLEDGLEVLYREGGFALNYVRGLSIVFCWLALVAALGLAAASLLSFPVAAFCSASVLVVVLSSSTLAGVVERGSISGEDHETGAVSRSPVDVVIIPIFKGILTAINLARDFSPVDALSTGRSISWAQLGRAFVQIVLLLGGILALIGVVIFQQRELATAQGRT